MYPVLDIKENERLLIIAPHPDDETIGCGGILSLYGPQCDVLLLTDGRRGIPKGSALSQAETAAVRKEEFVSVMNFFNVRSYAMLGIPDAELAANSRAVAKADLDGYDRIFVPNRNERHPDHRAAFEIIEKLLRKHKIKTELIEYEVWSPIISANRFVDISGMMDIKISGLRKYRSQIASIDYEVLAKGLNMYRGAPHHVEYCEAYYADYVQHGSIIKSALRKLYKDIRRKNR